MLKSPIVKFKEEKYEPIKGGTCLTCCADGDRMKCQVLCGSAPEELKGCTWRKVK